jgi:hypothetical protein
MTKSVNTRPAKSVQPARAATPVLPAWIERLVSNLPGERVYCRDGKVRTIAQVLEINRTRRMLWYLATTLEDEPQAPPRGVCEMDPDEPMAPHARFIECEPDYLETYRAETIRFSLGE